MAHPDLNFIPLEAAQSFTRGDDRGALTLLQRARAAQPPGTLIWAQLERLVGLLFIHMLREVEGTFALERADALLDELKEERPALEWLEERARQSALESSE